MAMKARRKALGLTQQDLADKSGLSLITVNQIERLNRSAEARSLDKIALGLDSSVLEMCATGNLLQVESNQTSRANLARNLRRIRKEKGFS